MIRRIAGAALGLAIAGGCVSPDASQHVVYARRATGDLSGQAVFPSGDARRPNAPCAVLLHGGAWVSGRREDMGRVARRLAASGIVCFSADYRLATVAPWPAPREDAEAAVAWVRAHASELGVDPRRVVAVGSSAGAQIALSLAVRGVCPAGSIYGPTDMAPGRMPTIEADVAATVGRDPALVADASPVRHVGPRTLACFLIQGEDDVVVPPRHATDFVTAMRAAGRPVELRLLPGHGHVLEPDTLDTWAAIDEMAAWITAL